MAEGEEDSEKPWQATNDDVSAALSGAFMSVGLQGVGGRA